MGLNCIGYLLAIDHVEAEFSGNYSPITFFQNYQRDQILDLERIIIKCEIYVNVQKRS